MFSWLNFFTVTSMRSYVIGAEWLKLINEIEHFLVLMSFGDQLFLLVFTAYTLHSVRHIISEFHDLSVATKRQNEMVNAEEAEQKLNREQE